MKKQQREKLFPFFKNNKNIVFLDSGVTSIKPKIVIDEISDFYEHFSFSFGRSRNKLNEKVYYKYKHSMENIGKFFNANWNEFIPVSSTTDGINKLANTLFKDFKSGDEIILGKFEHASNYLPWFELAKEKGIKIIFYNLNKNFEIDLDHLKTIVNDNTKLISITHKYNIFGSTNDIKKVREIIGKNIILVVDGAQAVGQTKIDLKELDCDYYIFSGHKMFSPFGIGMIFGKNENLQKINPLQFGGGMNIGYDEISTQYKINDSKFLAGTVNIEGIVGLSKAIDFINSIGIEKIEKHNIELKEYLENEIKKISSVRVINENVKSSVLYFEVTNSFGEIISQFLEDDNIFVRPGASCVKMENNIFKQFKAIRVSLHIYNNKDDIDKLISRLKSVDDFSKLKLDRKRYKNMDVCE